MEHPHAAEFLYQKLETLLLERKQLDLDLERAEVKAYSATCRAETAERELPFVEGKNGELRQRNAELEGEISRLKSLHAQTQQDMRDSFLRTLIKIQHPDPLTQLLNDATYARATRESEPWLAKGISLPLAAWFALRSAPRRFREYWISDIAPCIWRRTGLWIGIKPQDLSIEDFRKWRERGGTIGPCDNYLPARSTRRDPMGKAGHTVRTGQSEPFPDSQYR